MPQRVHPRGSQDRRSSRGNRSFPDPRGDRLCERDPDRPSFPRSGAEPAVPAGVVPQVPPVDDPERPRPGEGIILPESAIQMAEGGKPGYPDWDTALP